MPEPLDTITTGLQLGHCTPWASGWAANSPIPAPSTSDLRTTNVPSLWPCRKTKMVSRSAARSGGPWTGSALGRRRDGRRDG